MALAARIAPRMHMHLARGRAEALLVLAALPLAGTRRHGPGGSMAKEELMEFEGVVTDVLPEGRYRVRLSNDHELIA